jgi:hypothetical protein
MDEFSTFVFKENETKTHNKKVEKERLYIIGTLVLLIGIVLYLIDSPYTRTFMLIGIILFTIGQIVLSGRKPSVGQPIANLKLRKDHVLIGDDKIEIKNKEDIKIKLDGYKGQLIPYQTGFIETHSGNDNIMRIRYGGKEAEFKFVLESEHHKDKLQKFCKENDFNIM